jgi:hypothetical protein
MAVLVVVQVNTSAPSVAEALKRLGLAHWMMLIIMSTLGTFCARPRFCAQIIVTRSIVVRARASFKHLGQCKLSGVTATSASTSSARSCACDR